MPQGDILPTFPGGTERALARLAIAYLSPKDDGHLRCLRAAVVHWIKGEHKLAHENLRRGLGFPDEEDPVGVSYRLFVADYLFEQENVSPSDLLTKFGVGCCGQVNADYEQRKVETYEAFALKDSRTTAVLEQATELLKGCSETDSDVSKLLAMTDGLRTPALIAPCVAFIPSSGKSFVSGELPGVPDIFYLWNVTVGKLFFSRRIDGIDVPMSWAELMPNGCFYGFVSRCAHAAAAVLERGIIVDTHVISTSFNQAPYDVQYVVDSLQRLSQANEDSPQLHPDPETDAPPHNPSDEAIDYRTRVTGLPGGLGYMFNSVMFDGCYPFATKYMLETKADYNQHLDLTEYEARKAADPAYAAPWRPSLFNIEEKLREQIRAQTDAALPGPVIWHVNEEEAADAMRLMAKDYRNVIIVFDPDGDIRP